MEPEQGPLRRCIVTRERLPKERMVRFVLAPDRALVPDLAAGLPGRGMWLSARADVLETARTRGHFARAAGGPVSVPHDLGSLVRAGLAQRIGELLGFARRAAQAVAGFEKAREWVKSGRAVLIVQAFDGSADERARFLSGVKLPVVAPLPAGALGRLFGRDHVVHVAIAAGSLATAIAHEAERLSGFTGQDERAAGRSRRSEDNNGRVPVRHT
ncbi:MAG: RNA-binding protein [Acetobacteraceae bacterium]|nr:RNA-binding protein [Acetobacteraceae bacterium]MBV8523981.1 RNA-binding protein [Acetobacteraceae bacterium]